MSKLGPVSIESQVSLLGLEMEDEERKTKTATSRLFNWIS